MTSPSSPAWSRTPTLLLLLAALLAAARGAAAPCASDLDCALNGACSASTGLCACDAGWRGADCAQLDLLPAAQASGLHVANVSSWGASILGADAGVMFASVLVDCGLTSWQRNCLIARATPAAGDGGGLDATFEVADVAIPLWSTNVVALNATGYGGGTNEEAYLIFHVGDGTQDNSTLQACSPEGADGAGDAASADYRYRQGLIPTGHDVRVSALGEFATAAEAEAWCTANATCTAFTYAGPPDAIPASSNVFFKSSAADFQANAQWATYSLAVAPNGTSQCGLLWFPCDSYATCDSMPAVDGFDCVSYACSGDDAWAVAPAGPGAAEAAPGRALRDDVGCGARLADVMLPSCVGADECGVEAAGACEATPGCNAFAISGYLDNFTFAMLFASGREGLRPNAEWTAWVRHNASSGVAGAGRRSAPGPAASLGPPSPSAAPAGGSTFPVSFASSVLGPWTTVYANTTSPTNGNNPAPFLARNGSVFVVFNDGAMSMFRSDAGFRGPYSLVTTGTCGGGEDPVIFLGARGWHCLYHRTPFADPAGQAIGHAYSADGFVWHQSPGAAATSLINYDDGAGGVLTVTFGKRERPHLLFDAATGAPTAFVSAVGINPACDPFVFDTAGRPSIDAARLAAINLDTRHCAGVEGAWVQYQRLDLNFLPGYFDRSWTHVQRLRSAA